MPTISQLLGENHPLRVEATGAGIAQMAVHLMGSTRSSVPGSLAAAVFPELSRTEIDAVLCAAAAMSDDDFAVLRSGI